jgi:hypothetical protein
MENLVQIKRRIGVRKEQVRGTGRVTRVGSEKGHICQNVELGGDRRKVA